MDIACIERIDVHKRFFDVIIGESFKKAASFLGDEKDMQVTMNKVMSKPCAIEKALEIFKPKKNEYTELYISTDSLKCNQICDYWGERIFPDVADTDSGWVFFFDTDPFANWGHVCEYLFLVNDKCYELVEYDRGITEAIQIEKIY